MDQRSDPPRNEYSLARSLVISFDRLDPVLQEKILAVLDSQLQMDE